VASFTDRDKALALRDRLRKAKYPTFVESVAVKNSKLFRVRVGPVVRREHAEEWQKKIARDFKLKDALVMAHPG
jgi:cell division septation protein DedD